MKPSICAALTLVAGAASAAIQTDSTIRVDPGQTMNWITRWMYGSCIEDVNHEIYGGLYAQQMASENHLPLRVSAEVESPNHDLDVTATRSEDGKTLVLKVVNSGDAAHPAEIRLGSFSPVGHAAIWTLSGDLRDVNTPEAPERIRPVASDIEVPRGSFAYTFPRHSYTVIRLSR